MATGTTRGASVIRRAFDGMKIQGLTDTKQSDDEYVANAMKWYNTHKDNLAANLDYFQNSSMGRRMSPLFTWKGAPAKQE